MGKCNESCWIDVTRFVFMILHYFLYAHPPHSQFLLVLFAAMAAFAQMWVSFTFEPGQEESEYYMEGYLKAYTMMVCKKCFQGRKATCSMQRCHFHLLTILFKTLLAFPARWSRLGCIEIPSFDSNSLRALHIRRDNCFAEHTDCDRQWLLPEQFCVVEDGKHYILSNCIAGSYWPIFFGILLSPQQMLGKARVMFVSELMSLKFFHEMWMEGKTGATQRNVYYAFGVLAILHIWMISSTIDVKLSRGPHCVVDSETSRTELSATLAYLLLFTILFAMKKTLAYVLNEFNDTGVLKSPLQRRSGSLFQRAIIWFVKSVFSALSNSMDSLFDREASQKEVRGRSPVAQEHRTDKAIQRSIDKTRKTLKAELKTMFDQMQLSLREMEEQNKEDMSKMEDIISNAIASAIEESHQLMVEALQQQQSDRRAWDRSGSRDRVDISSIEEEAGMSDGSGSSLSVGDVERSSSN